MTDMQKRKGKTTASEPAGKGSGKDAALKAHEKRDARVRFVSDYRGRLRRFPGIGEQMAVRLFLLYWLTKRIFSNTIYNESAV